MRTRERVNSFVYCIAANFGDILNLVILRPFRQILMLAKLFRYHYTNLTFVCDVTSVRAGGHGKRFDPS